MAAESEMSAFREIRQAATEREWCPERPFAEAANRVETNGVPRHNMPWSREITLRTKSLFPDSRFPIPH